MCSVIISLGCFVAGTMARRHDNSTPRHYGNRSCGAASQCMSRLEMNLENKSREGKIQAGVSLARLQGEETIPGSMIKM